MANKKTSSKTNVMKLVWDALTLALGGLLLGFIALPHAMSEGTLFGHTTTTTVSGYELINFGDGYDTGVAVVLLLLTIFASLMVLGAIMKLLADLRVVNNNTFAKVATWMMLLCALAVAVLAIVNIITVSTAYTGDSLTIGSLASANWGASWGTLIVNGILGVGSLVTGLLSARK